MPLTSRQVARGVLTYGAAAACGWLFSRMHVPLPWMLGPLAITALASLAGLPVVTWMGLRNIGLTVVGTTLALYFTPAAAGQLLAHLPLILTAVAATLIIACAASLLLARNGGLDRVTAFFCSVPGGASEMCMLAHRFGGAPTPIAVSQMLRVVVLVVALPAIMTLGGAGDGIGVQAPPVMQGSGPGLALLLAVSGGVTLILVRLGMRNAWMLVPLIIGIATMLGGFEPAAMPGLLAGLAQIFLGAQLGAAFKRHDLMAVRTALPAILVNVGILTIGCAVVAVALATLSGASVPSFVLGTSPGGVTEMCLTARALGLEVPLVVGFHVCRVIIVMSATPWIFAALRRSGLIELPFSQHPSRGAA